jgi:predicted MFS family arabinose efflux permease
LNNKDKRPNLFLKFSTVGIQMAGTIAFFTWLGTFLDSKYPAKTPWWTIGLSLFGVISSLILVIKEVINLNKDNE